jgi:ectoine hydroxylase-related dioxygenase (phytanoyl-CoA dioxygenase family)
MKPIFNDTTLQINFERSGFVIVDLLNEVDLNLLLEIYNQYLGENVFKHFTTSNVSLPSEIKYEIANSIDKIVSSKIAKLMCDITFWPGAFLIKPSGEDSEFKAHQDWTFVDEEKFVSGNVWIPLSDVNIHNGCISVVESSQYPNIKSIRSQTIPDFFHTNREVIKPFLKAIDLKAGQALIFNHSLIHHSCSNTSGTNRIAVSKGFNSYDATLLHYLKTTNQTAELYEMPKDFVFKYDNLEDLKHKPINGKMIKTLTYYDKSYSDNEIIEILTKQEDINLIQVY